MAENHDAHLTFMCQETSDLRQKTDSALINALDETQLLM